MCQCNQQDKWQECISRGNTEYSLHYYGNAILMFQQALDEALYKFESTAISSHDRAISKVLICFFNLADCYIKLEQVDRAGDYYTQAQKFLIRVKEETSDNSDTLCKAIAHANSHIETLWSDFLKQYESEISYEHMMLNYKNTQILTSEGTIGLCH